LGDGSGRGERGGDNGQRLENGAKGAFAVLDPQQVLHGAPNRVLTRFAVAVRHVSLPVTGFNFGLRSAQFKAGGGEKRVS